jgi:hypothetical protein
MTAIDTKDKLDRPNEKRHMRKRRKSVNTDKRRIFVEGWRRRERVFS